MTDSDQDLELWRAWGRYGRVVQHRSSTAEQIPMAHFDAHGITLIPRSVINKWCYLMFSTEQLNNCTGNDRKPRDSKDRAQTHLPVLLCWADRARNTSLPALKWILNTATNEGLLTRSRNLITKAPLKTSRQFYINVQHNGPDEAFISSFKVYRHWALTHIHNVILSIFLMFHLVIRLQKLWDQLNHDNCLSFLFSSLFFFFLDDLKI